MLRSAIAKSTGAGGAWNERDAGWLVALPENLQGAVPPLEAEVLDVGAAGLADPQAVQAQQHGEGGVHR